jgi:hypothetical protein
MKMTNNVIFLPSLVRFSSVILEKKIVLKLTCKTRKVMTIAHLDLSVEKKLTFYSLLMRNLDSDSYLTPTQQLLSYIMVRTS